MANWEMDAYKSDKKSTMLSSFQQSFRIDDLLTRRDMEQQPDHFATIPSPSQPENSRGLTHHSEQVNGHMIAQKNSDQDSRNERKRDSTSGNDDDDDGFRKRKKARTAFSREQVSDLEKKFQEKKYLSSAERGELAERLKLSDMQVKTWFQNRRMKYKRQSEEAEMEMKSPKYPYSSFVHYGSVTPFYGYMPMPYKPENGMHYTYSPGFRSPQTPTDANFQPVGINSPTMISSLPSPLAMPQRPNPHIPRTNPTASFFSSNGVLTPLSPPTTYQQNYFSSDVTSLSAPTQMHFGAEWQRALPTPPTP